MKLELRKFFLGLACLLSLTLMVGNALAANLVVNGDFETGNNTGVTSDYTFVSPPPVQSALYPEGILRRWPKPKRLAQFMGHFYGPGREWLHDDR